MTTGQYYLLLICDRRTCYAYRLSSFYRFLVFDDLNSYRDTRKTAPHLYHYNNPYTILLYRVFCTQVTRHYIIHKYWVFINEEIRTKFCLSLLSYLRARLYRPWAEYSTMYFIPISRLDFMVAAFFRKPVVRGRVSESIVRISRLHYARMKQNI